mmetsp:Transcript_23613/g.74187  ORF Transcript_23613/g.74187 Transcript_23613/m.74187 type:complete len:298 (+) Transcript_23613:1174-2067(+)
MDEPQQRRAEIVGDVAVARDVELVDGGHLNVDGLREVYPRAQRPDQARRELAGLVQIRGAVPDARARTGPEHVHQGEGLVLHMPAEDLVRHEEQADDAAEDDGTEEHSEGVGPRLHLRAQRDAPAAAAQHVDELVVLARSIRIGGLLRGDAAPAGVLLEPKELGEVRARVDGAIAVRTGRRRGGRLQLLRRRRRVTVALDALEGLAGRAAGLVLFAPGGDAPGDAPRIRLGHDAARAEVHGALRDHGTRSVRLVQLRARAARSRGGLRLHRLLPLQHAIGVIQRRGQGAAPPRAQGE